MALNMQQICQGQKWDPESLHQEHMSYSCTAWHPVSLYFIGICLQWISKKTKGEEVHSYKIKMFGFFPRFPNLKSVVCLCIQPHDSILPYNY